MVSNYQKSDMQLEAKIGTKYICRKMHGSKIL